MGKKLGQSGAILKLCEPRHDSPESCAQSTKDSILHVLASALCKTTTVVICKLCVSVGDNQNVYYMWEILKVFLILCVFEMFLSTF